jgi:hypothetical protein
MTEPIFVDLSDVDQDNVDEAYLRLTKAIEDLLEEGISETEVFSAIGDVLYDLSETEDLAPLH